MQMYIVVAVMALFVIGMMSNKFSFGTVAMGCCVILVLTGVLKPTEAFAGFCDKNLLLMAGMFVIAYAFGKTSIVTRLQNKIMSTKGGKSDLILVVLLLFFSALLAQYIQSQMAIIMIMMAFLSSLGNTGKVTASRMMLPIAFTTTCWLGRLPIGGTGVSSYIMFNGLIEAAGSKDMLNVFSIAKATLIPALICLIYCIFTYKFLPSKEIDLSAYSQKGKEQNKIAKKDEIIIYICFVLALIGLLSGGLIGDIMYVIPIVITIVMIILGTLKSKEVLNVLSNDAIFMVAGVLVLANAMTKSGAGKLIGQGIMAILGGHPSPLMVISVLGFGTLILTSFISNSAAIFVLVPIACNICMTAGYDPRACVLCVSMCALMSMLTPMSSNGAALAFASAKLSVRETIKWTLPLALIGTISTIISCYVAYPMVK